MDPVKMIREKCKEEKGHGWSPCGLGGLSPLSVPRPNRRVRPPLTFRERKPSVSFASQSLHSRSVRTRLLGRGCAGLCPAHPLRGEPPAPQPFGRLSAASKGSIFDRHFFHERSGCAGRGPASAGPKHQVLTVRARSGCPRARKSSRLLPSPLASSPLVGVTISALGGEGLGSAKAELCPASPDQ